MDLSPPASGQSVFSRRDRVIDFKRYSQCNLRIASRPRLQSLLALVPLCLIALNANANDRRESEHAKKTLEIYRTIIEVDTSKTKGKTIPVARYLADELIAGGLPSSPSPFASSKYGSSTVALSEAPSKLICVPIPVL